MKPRFIDANMFLDYTGIDLSAELKNNDNPSAKVESFLGRVELRVMSWVDKNTFRVRDWNSLTNYQIRMFRYALLEQAAYMYRNGDIAQDSGYDQERGVVADKRALQEIVVCQPCIDFLIQAGLFNSTIKNRRRFMYENVMIGDGLPGSASDSMIAPVRPGGDPIPGYYTKEQIDRMLEAYELLSNKVTTLSGANNITYPTTEAVKDFAEHLIAVTYSDLKNLRDTSQLMPGRYYRITDYTCTTTTTNTSSAGNVFDIIVRADAVNILNEQAWAIHHEGDTYFANCNLAAWELKYCLDNDKDRFGWADATNGKGVIYYMKDEFFNECPYDFKNILFTKSEQYTNAYTFNYRGSDGNKDASIWKNSNCFANIIKRRGSIGHWELNFNVIYTNTSGFSSFCNFFGRRSYDNTLSSECSFNIISEECNNNFLGTYCTNNFFGAACRTNTFTSFCSYNTLGANCSFNLFDTETNNNVLEYGANNNTIARNSRYNVLGKYCSFNSLGRFSRHNIFGNNCSYISFGNPTLIQYVRYVKIDSGCSYINIYSDDISASSSNYLQNIHICLGVSGSSSTNPLNISVADRNLEYETTYKSNNSVEIIL